MKIEARAKRVVMKKYTFGYILMVISCRVSGNCPKSEINTVGCRLFIGYPKSEIKFVGLQGVNLKVTPSDLSNKSGSMTGKTKFSRTVFFNCISNIPRQVE